MTPVSAINQSITSRGVAVVIAAANVLTVFMVFGIVRRPSPTSEQSCEALQKLEQAQGNRVGGQR